METRLGIWGRVVPSRQRLARLVPRGGGCEGFDEMLVMNGVGTCCWVGDKPGQKEAVTLC